jgi:hypothetical protein
VRFLAPRADAVYMYAMVDGATAVATTTVRRPILTLATQPASVRVPRGATSAFDVVIRNVGALPSAAPQLAFTGVGFTSLTMAGAGWSCAGLTCTAAGALAPQQQSNVRVTFSVPNADVVATLTTQVIGPAGPDAGEMLLTTVVVGDHPDVELRVDGPATVRTGQAVEYAITARNGGTVAQPGPIVVEVTTAGLDDPLVSGWPCSKVDDDPEWVTCTRSGGLAPGAAAVPLTVRGIAAGSFPDTVDVAAEFVDVVDANPGNDSASFSTAYEDEGPGPIDSTPPLPSIAVGAPVSLRSPIALTWQASDASAIAGYDVETRVLRPTGAPASPWRTLRQATTTISASIKATAGHTVCARSRATDIAGNRSEWSAPRCTALPLNARQLKATGPWTTASASGAYGGQVRRTTTAQSQLSHVVVGNELWLVATVGPGHGSVLVRRNGEYLKLISLHALKVQRSVVISLGAVPPGPATITIEVLSSGRTVEIEGLAAYRG